MLNYLVCYEENNVKKWNMIKAKDNSAFLLELMQNPNVDIHSVFIIPTNVIMSGVWLSADTHKNQRVDFFNFFEDYGMKYEAPVPNETTQRILEKKEIDRKENEDSKYGFISPDGRYFHCGYQGHTALADRICFGMTETNNSERYLEEHGWCKIYKSPVSNDYDIYVGGKYVLTDEQVETLIKMGLDGVESISMMLCK